MPNQYISYGFAFSNSRQEVIIEYCEEAGCDVWDILTDIPQVYGFEWADDDSPRFQLEPQGYRIQSATACCIVFLLSTTPSP